MPSVDDNELLFASWTFSACGRQFDGVPPLSATWERMVSGPSNFSGAHATFCLQLRMPSGDILPFSYSMSDGSIRRDDAHTSSELTLTASPESLWPWLLGVMPITERSGEISAEGDLLVLGIVAARLDGLASDPGVLDWALFLSNAFGVALPMINRIRAILDRDGS